MADPCEAGQPPDVPADPGARWMAALGTLRLAGMLAALTVGPDHVSAADVFRDIAVNRWAVEFYQRTYIVHERQAAALRRAQWPD
jgi:hypothetical protein